MKQRDMIKTVRGQRAVDGAGVRLVRVLGNATVRDFDPFLMLDSFDSADPSDYVAGFPTHPHRGIETITYLISGRIDHEDSLGNKGTIFAGESQWMTAGSGILHQEMPKPAERMLGFQLWLNLPRSEKMADPAYLSITNEAIGLIRQDKAEIRVLSGRFGDAAGVAPQHIPASIFDICLSAGGTIDIPTKPDETVFVFLIEGDAVFGGETVPVKTAVLFGVGDSVAVSAPADADARFIFISGKPLHEPVAWGGPIVMNTREELEHAFDELDKGTFIRHG
ncbi:MAG: pirin family protein [Eubacteriales bacterium]|nr:pirin family protein [Eubacteriales bacterium]